jgi:L-fuculose-phosphate aldolase
MSYQDERQVRQAIVDIHRKLYELGFSVANDGNTSVRLDPDKIFITPMGLNKAALKVDQICVIDAKGNTLSSNGYTPSSERQLHTAIYDVRPDAKAIIHAHPPHAIACTLVNVSLKEPVLPEVIVALGAIPTARYAVPSTKDFGDAAAEEAKNYDAVVLDRHGAVTLGQTLDEALQKMERLEHTAKIMSIASAVGRVTPLTKPEADRLRMMSGRPDSMDNAITSAVVPEANDELVELIIKEVKAAMVSRKV